MNLKVETIYLLASLKHFSLDKIYFKMSKNLLLVFLFLGTFCTLSAQKDESDKAVDSLVAQVRAVKFKTEGVVALADGKVNLNIPKGFKYLDAQQTHFVLEKLWGNPPQDDDGMLFPMDADLLQNTSWAFVIKYQKDGHIDDSDAAAIKYDELLTSMKESVKEESGNRVKEGYEAIDLIGWASQPYYDASQKTLHWAKEVKFGQAEEHTLNYDVRILGREGLISMNAIGKMTDLDSVKKVIPNVLTAVTFGDGHKYSDFNPSIDKVAAYGIGGLIAGKVLAKAGIFVFLLKYLKFIGLAVVGFGSWFMNKIRGRKEEETTEIEPPYTPPTSEIMGDK